MKLRLLIAILVCSVCNAIAADNATLRDSQPESVMEKANACFDKYKFPEALHYYTLALEKARMEDNQKIIAASSSTFIKIFKSSIGITPAAYRKISRTENNDDAQA